MENENFDKIRFLNRMQILFLVTKRKIQIWGPHNKKRVDQNEYDFTHHTLIKQVRHCIQQKIDDRGGGRRQAIDLKMGKNGNGTANYIQTIQTIQTYFDSFRPMIQTHLDPIRPIKTNLDPFRQCRPYQTHLDTFTPIQTRLYPANPFRPIYTY